MQISFSFKHMETSEALKEHAEKKLGEKLRKFATKNIKAIVFFSVERMKHKATVKVTGGDGFNFEVSSDSHDMYVTVDQLVEKLTNKMKKHKEKLKNHKKVSNVRTLPVRHQWDKLDSDSVPVDAEDLIKYEHARKRLRAG